MFEKIVKILKIFYYTQYSTLRNKYNEFVNRDAYIEDKIDVTWTVLLTWMNGDGVKHLLFARNDGCDYNVTYTYCIRFVLSAKGCCSGNTNSGTTSQTMNLHSAGLNDHLFVL